MDISRRRTLAAGLVLGSLAALPRRAIAAALDNGGGHIIDRARIDSLSTNSPWFDAQLAFDNGFNAAVIDLAIYPRNRANALAELEQWRRGAEAPGSSYALIGRADDFERARRAGKFGVLLACQDASIVDTSMYSVSDENLENLRELCYRGLRVLQLTHNERNAIGDSFMERDDAGLSRLGKAMVVAMAEQGMIVDLSHCSDLTTRQATELSPKPVAVTHAGCRALFPSARNKPDWAIRALADKGGYFGVFMMTRWLVADKAKANVECVVDHIAHVVKIGGIDTAGFGSDRAVLGEPGDQATKVARLANYQRRNAGVPGVDALNGHETAEDLENPRRLGLIDAALQRRGFAGAARDKILGGNFVRLVAAVCG